MMKNSLESPRVRIIIIKCVEVVPEASETEPNTQGKTPRVNTPTETPHTEGFLDRQSRVKPAVNSKWKEITMERVNAKAKKIGEHTFKATGSCNLECYVCGGYTNDKNPEDSACVCRECSLVIHSKCANEMRSNKCLKKSTDSKSDYQFSPMKLELMKDQVSPEKDLQSEDVVLSGKSKQASELAPERNIDGSASSESEKNVQKSKKMSNMNMESQKGSGNEVVNAACSGSRIKSRVKSKWKEITMERVNTKAKKIGEHTFKATGSCNLECYVCGGYTNDKNPEDSSYVRRECLLVVHRKCANEMRSNKCLKKPLDSKSDYQFSLMKLQMMMDQLSPEEDLQLEDVFLSGKSKQASEVAPDDNIDGSASSESEMNVQKSKKMYNMNMESQKKSGNGHEFVNVACSGSQNKCMVCQIPVHSYLKSYMKCIVCNKYCHNECIPHNMLKCNAKENRTYISLSVEKHKFDESDEEFYDLILKRLYDYEINKRANTRLRLSVWVNYRSREIKYETGSQNMNVRTFLLREFPMPLQEIELNLDIRILKSELRDDDMLVVELQAVKQFAGPLYAPRPKSATKHDTESFRKCFSFSACQFEKDNLSGNFAFLDVEKGLVCNMKMPSEEKIAASHNKDVEKEAQGPSSENGEVQSDSDSTSVEVVTRASRPKSEVKASVIEKIAQKIDKSDLIRNKDEKIDMFKKKEVAVKNSTASDATDSATMKDPNTDSKADTDQK
ncbi:MAG: hypothetical protein MHMPM18_001986 [Marteilia pararefringens]